MALQVVVVKLMMLKTIKKNRGDADGRLEKKPMLVRPREKDGDVGRQW